MPTKFKQRSNAYTRDFMRNYRYWTRTLGDRARNSGIKNMSKVDKETKSIMDRIKLPTYLESIDSQDVPALINAFNTDSYKTEQEFNKTAQEWEDENFYYKLRAAQILKQQPAAVRDKILDNFKEDEYAAKKVLDKIVDEQNKKEDSIEDTFLRASGQRWTDDKGITHTQKGVTVGPANLDEAVERLGGTSEDKTASMGEVAAKDSALTDDQQKAMDTAMAEDAGDVVEYTYKPGDTFGQVILDLGLNTDRGLWGDDGDVEFYAKQLDDQLNKSGVWHGVRDNIPIGTTIKLKRRPAEEAE